MESTPQLRLFLLLSFSVWIVSLLLIYPPTARFVFPAFPYTINGALLALFVGSTALCAVSSLLVGMNLIGVLPNLRLRRKW